MITNTLQGFTKTLILSCLGLALISCATIEASNVADKEQLLAAAGFTMKLADTPAKLAHLKTLNQQKIVPHSKDGTTYFVYADATDCQCMYVGDQKAYQAFQKMQVDQNMADDQRMTAEMNEDAQMNWGMWGYGSMGGPWGY